MSAFEPKGDVHREPSNIQALMASDPRVCSGFARSLISTNATLEGSFMGNLGNDRRIDNIEFTVSDIARSREFYGKAFGWTFTDYGSTYCEFSDGRLTGGFAKGDPMSPGGPLVILYADDLSRLALKTPAQGSSNRFLPFPAADAFISMTWMDTNWPYGPTSRTRWKDACPSSTFQTSRCRLSIVRSMR